MSKFNMKTKDKRKKININEETALGIVQLIGFVLIVGGAFMINFGFGLVVLGLGIVVLIGEFIRYYRF